MKKFNIFDQNHGLTPLEKCQFSTFIKLMFLKSRKACFLSRTAQNTFFYSILPEKKEPNNF